MEIVTTYKAFDDKEFKSEDECKEYEGSFSSIKNINGLEIKYKSFIVNNYSNDFVEYLSNRIYKDFYLILYDKRIIIQDGIDIPRIIESYYRDIVEIIVYDICIDKNDNSFFEISIRYKFKLKDKYTYYPGMNVTLQL